MAIEFDLARAMTAGSLWSDPKHVKGGKPALTPDDIRAAVSMSLAGHPFAFHALMAKYCHDEISMSELQSKMDEFGSLVYLQAYPNQGLKGQTHRKLTEFAIKVYFSPAVYLNLLRQVGAAGVDAKAADYVGVSKDTWRARYQKHFTRITAQLFELEAAAVADYHKIMARE